MGAYSADSADTPVKNTKQVVAAESEEETVKTPSENLQLVPEDLLITPKKHKVQYSLARFWKPSPQKEGVN